MNEKDILNFAKRLGYSRIDYEGKWQGYDTYAMGFISPVGESVYVGLPFYALVKDGEISRSRPDEAFEILNHFGNEES